MWRHLIRSVSRKDTAPSSVVPADPDASSNALLGAIHAFAEAVEAKDPYTAGHTWRVTRYALLLAEYLDLPTHQRQQLALGGVLHDVGKVGIRDAVLTKPARLTDSEFAHIRTHPEIGARIVHQAGPLLAGAVDCVESHHERWDGRGYPNGLAGERIPLVARVMAVADTFDAMTSSRPYQTGRSTADGLAEVARQREQQFDPQAADALVALGARGALDQVWRQTADGALLPCVICDAWVIAPSHADHAHTAACPVCSARFRLVERDGRLEVAQLVSLCPNKVAQITALPMAERTRVLSLLVDRLAAASIADPGALVQQMWDSDTLAAAS